MPKPNKDNKWKFWRRNPLTYVLSCLMKLEKLLCLKNLGSKILANSGGFHTMKLLFEELHDTIGSVVQSSTISYVFERKGGSELELPWASSIPIIFSLKITNLNNSQIQNPELKHQLLLRTAKKKKKIPKPPKIPHKSPSTDNPRYNNQNQNVRIFLQNPVCIPQKSNPIRNPLITHHHQGLRNFRKMEISSSGSEG